MAVVDRNNALRAEIDKSRHNRNTLAAACAALEKEIKGLAAESSKLEQVIQQKALARDEVEHEVRSLKQESNAQQEELEQTWMTLGQSSSGVSAAAEVTAPIAPSPSVT
jgi:peptidoglycan hydrolase CwlO-like protein